MNFYGDTSKYIAGVLLLAGMLLGILAIDRSEEIMASTNSIDIAFAIAQAQGY